MIYLKDITWKSSTNLNLPQTEQVECEVDFHSNEKLYNVLKDWLERKYQAEVLKFNWVI